MYTIKIEAAFHIEVLRLQERLDKHIRSELYFQVLSVMKLAREPPKIYFHEILDTIGLGYVEALRTTSQTNQ